MDVNNHNTSNYVLIGKFSELRLDAIYAILIARILKKNHTI